MIQTAKYNYNLKNKQEIEFNNVGMSASVESGTKKCLR